MDLLKMKDRTEICGILDSFEQTEGNIKLKFVFSKVIKVPLEALPVKKIQEMVGRRIGIICMEGKYRLRKISD